MPSAMLRWRWTLKLGLVSLWQGWWAKNSRTAWRRLQLPGNRSAIEGRLQQYNHLLVSIRISPSGSNRPVLQPREEMLSSVTTLFAWFSFNWGGTLWANKVLVIKITMKTRKTPFDECMTITIILMFLCVTRILISGHFHKNIKVECTWMWILTDWEVGTFIAVSTSKFNSLSVWNKMKIVYFLFINLQEGKLHCWHQ